MLSDGPFKLSSLVEESSDSVVSRAVLKSPAGNVTVFAFAAGEGLSTHAAPYDALVNVIHGEAEITIGEKTHTVRAGEAIVMPANIPHALHATTAFKMMLVMIKG